MSRKEWPSELPSHDLDCKASRRGSTAQLSDHLESKRPVLFGQASTKRTPVDRVLEIVICSKPEPLHR